MNVNPESERYGEIVAWDSLTEQEQKSGDWLKLPTHDENGEPMQARRKTGADRMREMFSPPKTEDAEASMRRMEMREHREATREGIWPSRR